jgi:predicted MFS family arabinose efflux permease
MLLAAPFAGAEQWRATFLAHGVAAVLLGVAAWQLPAAQPRGGPTGHGLSSLAAVLREIGVVRLGLAFAAVTVAGLGVNVALPQYLANLHHVSVSAAATILAALSATSILGGVLVGVMLARGFATWLVAALLCIGALLSALLLFVPHTAMALSVVALLAWQLTMTGGFVALIMALIPRRLNNPAVTGMANGLIVQMSCVAATVAPPIFLAVLASGEWWNFIWVIGGCVALAFLAMPLADPGNKSFRGAVQQHD